MAEKLALVNISIPGKLPEEIRFEDHPTIAWFISLLKEREWQRVDTVAGWGNLNQDWLEFRCTIMTSWSWCVPTFLSTKEIALLLWLLNRGDLLMHVDYIEEKNGKEEFIPHR